MTTNWLIEELKDPSTHSLKKKWMLPFVFWDWDKIEIASAVRNMQQISKIPNIPELGESGCSLSQYIWKTWIYVWGVLVNANASKDLKF